MNKHLVAVYGSLMSNHHNHDLLEDAQFIAKGQGMFHATMCANGSFPYLTVEEPDAKPFVEVYEVDDQDLKSLDALEGHPDWYKRELRSFMLDNGEQTKAWVYIMPDPTSTIVMACDLVPNGDWATYYKDKK